MGIIDGKIRYIFHNGNIISDFYFLSYIFLGVFPLCITFINRKKLNIILERNFLMAWHHGNAFGILMEFI